MFSFKHLKSELQQNERNYSKANNMIEFFNQDPENLNDAGENYYPKKESANYYPKKESSNFYPKKGSSDCSEAPQMPNFNLDDLIKNSSYLPEKDFLILEELGTGGFGKVFKAYHKHSNKFVAIKFLKGFSSNAPKKKFEQSCVAEEITILTKVEKKRKKDITNSPFLKFNGVYRNPKEKDTLIMVMENGEVSLEDLLTKAKKKFSQQELEYILFKLSEILFILEQKGIFHGDVKPANFVIKKLKEVNKEGIAQNISSFSVHVVDFGISLQLPKKSNLVNAAHIKGWSKAYKAPEIPEDKKPVKLNPFKADVYSLGISMMNLMGFHKKEDFKKSVDSKKINEQEKLGKLILKMLHQDPENRPTFSDILKDLGNVAIPKQENLDPFIHFVRETNQHKRLKDKCKIQVLLDRHQVQAREKVEMEVMILRESFEENMQLFFAYFENISRIYDSKYHIEKCYELLNKNAAIFPLDRKRDCLRFLAMQYEKLCDFKNAEKFQLELINLLEEKYEDDGALIEQYNNLGFLYEKTQVGKAEETIMKSQELLEQMKNGLKKLKKEGKIDQDMHIKWKKLGDLYAMIGNYRSAIKYYEIALKCIKADKNFDPLDEFSVLLNLGKVNNKLGFLEKSEKYYIEALEKFKCSQGEENIETATVLQKLGIVYKRLRRFKEAKRMLRKSLMIRKALFGEVHFESNVCVQWMGLLFLKMGTFMKAEKHLNKNLQINLNLHEEPHEDLAKSYHNLAKVFKKTEQYEKADENYQKSLKIYEEIGEEYLNERVKLLADMKVFYKKTQQREKMKLYMMKCIDLLQKMYESFGEEQRKNYDIQKILKGKSEDEELKNDQNRKFSQEQPFKDFLIQEIQTQKKIQGKNKRDIKNLKKYGECKKKANILKRDPPLISFQQFRQTEKNLKVLKKAYRKLHEDDEKKKDEKLIPIMTVEEEKYWRKNDIRAKNNRNHAVDSDQILQKLGFFYKDKSDWLTKAYKISNWLSNYDEEKNDHKAKSNKMAKEMKEDRKLWKKKAQKELWKHK